MNIPNYAQLVKLVSGLEEVLKESPEKIVQFWETNNRSDFVHPKTTTVRELREVLETCTYADRWPGWVFVFPGEYDGRKEFYRGIYAGPCFEPSFWVNILETDFQI
jgi:hypothetical protein